MTPAAYRGEDAGVAGAAEAATGPATASCAVGLAALWYFLYKRLRYPVLYAYLRTGNDGAFLAQDVHNVALALGAFAMLLLLVRFGRRLFRGRAAAVAVVAAGIAGGAGLVLLARSGFAGPGDTALACLGAALAGVFVPVYLGYWGVAAWQLGRNRLARALVGSFALFAGATLLLNGLGVDSIAVSAACPPISAAMAAVYAHASAKTVPAGTAAKPVAEEPAGAGGYAGGTAACAPAADGHAETAAPAGGDNAGDAEAAGGGDARLAGAAPAAPPRRAGSAAAPPAPATTAPMPARAGGSDDARSSRNAAIAGVAGPAAPEGGAGAFAGFGAAYGLSPREVEITALAYRNYNARRIAGELFIAESTVYTHLKRIYRKVDVHSKQELIDRIDAHRAQAG